MALVLKDRVKETTTTTGTGTVTLAGAATGFQSFAAVGDGNTTYYAIVDAASGDWEVGIGTYTASGTTLSRTTVLSSSNAGSLVNFGAGTKDVFVTYPSSRSVYQDTTGMATVQNEFNTLNAGTINVTTANITGGTVSTTPTSGNDLVNKTYVDTMVSSGITYHTPVKYEVPDSTGNLNATYNNGTAGVGATLTNAGTLTAFTPDGITAQVGDRVLVYNQTNAYENGVYTVTTVGSGSVAWVLTRATDADSYALKDPNALGEGDAFFITSGNTGAGETYVCNTTGTITFGTTAITFVQVSDATLYTAGTGLTLSGTQFSITNTGVSAATYGSASSVPVIAVNAQGQATAVTDTPIAISGSAVSGDITGKSGGTTAALTAGAFLNAAGTFDGSTARTFDVNATSNNTASTVVARDASGNFSAGTITATLSGSATSATTATNLSGGAANRIPYQTGAGATSFAIAPSATGQVLGWNGSAFTWYTGTISGVQLGSNLNSLTAGSYLTGSSYNGSGAVTFAVDATSANTASKVVARDASGNFSAGTITANLSGNATTATSATSATSATTATNLAGGSAGTVPYQSASGTTVQLAAGSAGQYLKSNGAAAPSWDTLPTIGNGTLTMNVSGTGLSGSQTFTANQSGNATFTVTSNATSANTASTIVARDASGNFSAGTITAALSGNASTATILQTSRNINEVGFNGSANITIPRVRAIDDRTVAPADGTTAYATFGFGSWNNNNSSPYADFWLMRSYVDSSGGSDNMVMFRKDALGMRVWQQTYGSSTAFSTYKDVAWTDGTNASGTWGINITGNAATVGGLTPIQFFNNMGDNHGQQADFSSITNFGFRYVQGATNGPGTGAQYYGITLGLGNDYAYSQYASQLYWPRTPLGSNTPYLSIRFRESGTWGSWTKIWAGYADSAGSVDYNSLTNKTGGTGTYTTSGDYRAPIFYDSNNTGYYVDPASTSYMNALQSNRYSVGNSNPYDQVSDSPWYGLGQSNAAGPWGPGMVQLAGYYGIRTRTAHGVFDIGAPGWGTSWIYSDYNLAVAGQARATIYYDYNDTGYYVDPASTSVFNGATVYGAWYFQSNQNTGSGSSPPLQAFSTGGNGAMMAFHRGGYYAINMGLDSDNVFRIGGWSASANRFQMDMSGNLTMAGNVTAYSDERLKKDWSYMADDFVERLAAVKAGTYTRIDSNERQAGASAQDWQELLPEVVSEDAAGTLALAYGNAAVVACVELAKSVVALRAEIKALRGQ